MLTRTLLVLLVGCGFHGAQGNDAQPIPIDAAPDPFQDAPGSGIDAAPGTSCYGPDSGVWRVCLGAAPMSPQVLTNNIDTGHDTRCLSAQPTGWYPAQPSSCFIVGSAITVPVGVTVHVSGPKPLVLLADTTITIDGTLDVGSHSGGTVGPAAGSTECMPWVQAPRSGMHGGGGGGAGASFVTKGGDGGTGDKGHAAQGQSPAGGTTPAHLRGGCGGQHGAGGGHFPFPPPPPNSSGAGGGAVYLLAKTGITITNAVNASGSGGSGGDHGDGGDGGGTGGMIVLYAPAVAATTLVANGGGGGGGGALEAGGSGADGNLALTAASGGDGVVGGNGYMLATDAQNGTNGDMGEGGGAGGGGAGFILSNVVLVVGTFSPAPTHM